MRFILSNPSGLWALAAIPLVVLIYFLQERTRRVRVTTLFLLERIPPESVGGVRFERLRSTWPMWLQMLAVVFLAWILSEPRWMRADARQDIVIVLDSSVSMQAFKSAARDALSSKAADWRLPGVVTQWHLLESDPRVPTLYSGQDFSLMLGALDQWQPMLGTHDFLPALSTARGLVRERSGGVVLVTDRKLELPSDISLLAVGRLIENCGFIGASTVGEGGDAAWRVLVRNHGTTSQRREWWVETPGLDAAKSKSQPRAIDLQPGEALALEGAFVPESDRCILALSPDAFDWDDHLPLVRPKPRKVRVGIGVGGERAGIMRRMLESLPDVEVGTNDPDMLISPWEGQKGESLAAPALHEILLPRPLDRTAKLDPNWIVSADHPLVRELNWMPLLGPAPLEMNLMDNDAPLLWRGPLPACVLRSWGGLDQLVLNIDIENSNAARVPAFVLLLHRYIEQVRSSLPGERSVNTETSQSLAEWLPTSGARKWTLEIEGEESKSIAIPRAPQKPGFYEIKMDGVKVVRGAAYFADAREADFRDANEFDGTEAMARESRLANSDDDPLRPLWILLAALCLLAAWVFQAGKRAGRTQVEVAQPV